MNQGFPSISSNRLRQSHDHSPHQVGTSFQPGKEPISSFQPVSEEGSRTARTLVSDFSFASSALCGSVCSGGFERSGIGHRRIVPSSLPEAIQCTWGETATLETEPVCPKSRWGSSGVGRLQAARRLDRKGENLARGGGVTGNEGFQRLAFEQLGDDVGGAVVHADVEDGQDVRVVQRGDGTGFALESLHALRAAGHLPG